MKTPVLIGSIIFAVSILVAAVAILKIDFVDPDVQGQFIELSIIWGSGIIGGLGLGYGNRETYGGYESSQTPTAIGGVGIAGVFLISLWLGILGHPPLAAVVVSAISGILSFVGMYMIILGSGEEGY